MLQLFMGLMLGIVAAVWYLLGSRLKWNIPHHRRVEDDFTGRDKFWTTYCVGDADVLRLDDPDTRGGTFARLIVNRADEDQLALAQIDDYAYRPTADFPWTPILRVEARLRFSEHAPGTAGLFLWNNPIGLGAELPNLRPLKWIGFSRTPPNGTMRLSGTSPGFRASVVNGSWLGMLSMFGVPLLPRLRADAVSLDGRHDWTQWHTYIIEWWRDRVELYVDGEKVLHSRTRLKGPLSLVIWQDNRRSHISDGKFDRKFDAIDSPVWIDVDYLIIEPML